MALGGCVDIQVVDRAPSILEVTPGGYTETVDEHNLAVLAVDFDPQLEYDQIVARRDRGEGITLLVAVENTGASREDNVSVGVELFAEDGKTAFLQKQGTIESIAPGEIKIVQFEDTDIPFSYTYVLSVHVSPVTGETQLGDNRKSYDLLVTQP